jgi:hypothetical protein
MSHETVESYELDDIVDLDEHVLTVGASAAGVGSGVPIDQPLARLWTFAGLRAVRARSFSTRADALEAVRRRG